MLPYRWLSLVMMLQLVVAHLHCLCHHEHPALQPNVLSQTAPRDPMPQRHCHNEFGCICKGALVVECTDCDAPTLAHDQSLPIEVCALESTTTQWPAGDVFDPGRSPTGRMLRVQFSTFLI